MGCLKSSLLLLLACSVRALLLPNAAGASLRAGPRAGAPCMKHNDYFMRIQRAESGRMRLCVSRSNNHIYGQVIDDSKDAVLATASTMEPDLRESLKWGGNCEAAAVVGKRLGERSLEKGIAVLKSSAQISRRLLTIKPPHQIASAFLDLF